MKVMTADLADVRVLYRDVPGFEGYRVGADGSVWSCRTTHGIKPGVWKRLRPRTSKQGQLCVALALKGKMVPRRVHRLVLEAFVGPCPEGMEACHNNGDMTDNRPSNLRWDTHKNNMQDMVRHGTSQRGEKNHKAKLTEGDVRAIRELRSSGARAADLAARFDVSLSSIRFILSGRTWAHVA